MSSNKKAVDMSREQFQEVVKANIEHIKLGAKLIGNLADVLSKSNETSTTAFQDACDLLREIEEVKKSTRIIRDALDRRASAQKNEIRRGEYKQATNFIKNPNKILGIG
jgi:hypothetical protein